MALKRTHLHAYHEAHGRLVDFGGFEMPVWFEGIIPEHHAVRNAVGIFDTSHMGRTMAEGPEAERFLDHVVTNNVAALEPMTGLYTVMCNPEGGIVDDLIVYKLDAERFFIVYNASNRRKDYAWFQSHAEGFDVSLREVSDEVAMIAVQGPRAEETLQRICPENVSEIGRFQLGRVKVSGFDAMAARTGYTGEDGFEIFLPDTPVGSPERALTVWNDLLEAGGEFGIKPCGLGARDSLRLEAGLCLYGNDIDEETNPLEARLRWVVKFKKPGGFIGREALLRVREEGVKRRRVGIMMEERGIPRHGYEIWSGGSPIGVVTSGGLSPTLGVGIAMGYVPRSHSKLGTPVEIKIRSRLAKGKIVKSHPFYDESKYGWKREEK
ncbi:MAG: glycine cleavage system aminomethyltransferase GcvT [Candidatus Bathyarchaeia archaeon]